jgi:protein gp37
MHLLRAKYSGRTSWRMIGRSPYRWLLLTKRPRRMAEFSRSQPLPANVWPGTSITSPRMLRRVDELLTVQGGGPRWLSIESLWGPVDLSSWLLPRRWRANGTRNENPLIPPEGGTFDGADWRPGMGWVIVGGESGHDEPPMDPAWVRAIRDQCQASGVAFFFKQWGERAPVDHLQAVRLLHCTVKTEDDGWMTAFVEVDPIGYDDPEVWA